GLVGDQGALTPVVGTVNNLLGSLTGGGQSGGLLGGLLGGGQSGGQSGGLLGGLLGGGQGGGLLGGLLGGGQGGSGNVLDLSTGIVLPQNQLGNTLDTVLTPILKPVEGLVNSLLGTLSPVLNPVLGVVNGITGGLGIELPKDLHLDLVDDLSMALKGEKPLNLEILANNGNILGLADTNSGGGTNPNLPGSDLNAVLYDDASKQKVTLAGGANGTTITNVKAGAVNATSTDAVNGSQLHALDERVTTNTTNITNLDQRVTTNTTNITNLMDGKAGLVQQAAPNAAITVGKDTGGSEVNFSNKEGNARKLTGVQAGAVTATSTEAINGAQLHTTNQSIVATNQAVADALGSDGAKLNSNGIVNTPQYNLSSGQYMSVGAALHGLDQNSIQYDANTNKGNITLGGANGTTITNVKAGAVNKTSTEAINGAQLYATNKSIADALGGNTVVNIDGSISGTTYNINEITQGGVVNNNYTNVGDAFNSVSNSVTNLYNQVNDGKIGLVQQASPNAAITVGKSTGGNEVNFRNESGEARRLTGVAEAVDGTDAVNLDQVTRMVQGATPADLTEVRNDISSLRGDVRRVEKRADAGAATAMAVAGLPQAYLPGKSMVSMAGGVYASESGYALGASTVTENGKWVLKGSVAGSSRGQMGATIGAGYQW
ncbi:MAG: hypothetical protein GX040_02920, partial [Alcaligenaceae bacterium]|nr:hypothetical protein [Alcaligenaceae bacterium]